MSKRARKVYRITEAGHRLFEQLLDDDSPAGTADAKSFGLRLAFARHLAPHARLSLLERRRAQLVRRLASDRARARTERLDVYARSLVEHSTEVTEHDISWLDRLIESERQRQPTGGDVDPHDRSAPGTASEPERAPVRSTPSAH